MLYKMVLYAYLARDSRDREACFEEIYKTNRVVMLVPKYLQQKRHSKLTLLGVAGQTPIFMYKQLGRNEKGQTKWDKRVSAKFCSFLRLSARSAVSCGLRLRDAVIPRKRKPKSAKISAKICKKH